VQGFSQNDIRSNPSKKLESQEITQMIQKAIQKLPEEQRLVLIMKEYQGMKFREIAESLEISENTAKSRLYYALKALKKTLNDWNIHQEILNYVI
jgi:RNA polymerase sigma-70 factor (ECF subfamily)